MFFSRPQLKTRRLTAWLILLVCVWMGTGGVLHHTEAEGTAQAAQMHTAPSLHPMAAVPSDTCAACEWTQGLQGHTLPILALSFALLSLPLCLNPALPAPIARTPRYCPSRAPPALLA